MKQHHFLIIGIVCIFMGILVGTCTIGCQSNETLPSLENLGDGNELEIESKQSSNNPWPWLIAVIAMPVLFLGYLYLSKSFTGFGRK